MPERWTVVKVGGSLFDWPELGDRLRTWLTTLDAANVLLVPGGGATADAIRELDRTHHLGEEVSHWLAIQALSLNAHFLQALIPDAVLFGSMGYSESQRFGVPHPRASAHSTGSAEKRIAILDAYPFFLDDERRPDALPHRWDVTSDSLALRAATLVEACELILLKSTNYDVDDWNEASRAGIVDPYFATLLRGVASEVRVRVINLRAAPDAPQC